MIQIPNKILVVVAHPDDEILGCGGYLAKMMKARKEVKVLILNDGCDVREGYSPDKLAIYKQCINANKLIGVKDVEVCDFPTGKFDRVPQIEINKQIEHHVKHWEPDTVLTHCEDDLHKDHEIVSRCVKIATRSFKSCSVKNVFSFPIVSSSNFNTKPFRPDVYVNIEKEISLKVHAMRVYKEEYKKTGLRGDQGIRTQAAFYGMESGFKYAEVFKVERCRF